MVTLFFFFFWNNLFYFYFFSSLFFFVLSQRFFLLPSSFFVLGNTHGFIIPSELWRFPCQLRRRDAASRAKIGSERQRETEGVKKRKRERQREVWCTRDIYLVRKPPLFSYRRWLRSRNAFFYLSLMLHAFSKLRTTVSPCPEYEKMIA